LPLLQRIPKLKGFTNPFRVEYTPVNLDALARWVLPTSRSTCRRARARAKEGLREGLGRGELTTTLNVSAHRFSASAKAAIEARVVRRAKWRCPSPFVLRHRATNTRTARVQQWLRRLGNIFRVPDLRNKVLFTIGIICLYQAGANIPIPGVSWSQVQDLQAKAGASGVLGFLNLFSGGALTRLAVFGLGVMPYITSSIVIQLLTTVIPKLTQWRDQGAVGQKKITQTTRYLTIGLALLQSTGLIYAFHGHDQALLGFNIDLIPKFNLSLGLFMVAIMTAGTAFVMWLAELITQRGIGQGMSLLIFANVVAGIPSGGHAVLDEGGPVKFVVLLLVSIALLVLIVFMDNGQRRIPVTFARRVVGRKEMGGNSTYIPLKVNQSGVIRSSSPPRCSTSRFC